MWLHTSFLDMPLLGFKHLSVTCVRPFLLQSRAGCLSMALRPVLAKDPFLHPCLLLLTAQGFGSRFDSLCLLLIRRCTRLQSLWETGS